MSKAAKLSVLILFILMVGAVGLAGLVYYEKDQVSQQKVSLENQLSDFQSREKKYLLENKELNDKVQEVEKAKEELAKKLGSFDGNIEDLDDQIKQLQAERDQWKGRVDELTKERENLLVQIEEKSKPTMVVSKPIESQMPSVQIQQSTNMALPPQLAEDNYWAQVIKEKTDLELQLENIKKNLSENLLDVNGLKKDNSDLQLEITKLLDERKELESDLKHAQDLADTLSLEMARSQNEKKFVNERMESIKMENVHLRDEIKKLTNTKIALERTVIKLQDEKQEISRKLDEAENVVQSRIDEIWKIKDSIDERFSPAKESGHEVELPPIVVTADDELSKADSASDSNVDPAGLNGNIVSVNDENNFVIVDIGDTQGLKLGDNLNVYRGSEYIGALEIIQVRDNISAADIRTQITKLQVGDVVR